MGLQCWPVGIDGQALQARRNGQPERVGNRDKLYRGRPSLSAARRRRSAVVSAAVCPARERRRLCRLVLGNARGVRIEELIATIDQSGVTDRLTRVGIDVIRLRQT